MDNLDSRVEALLHAPLGCAFLLVAEASRFSLDTISQPVVQLYVAANAVNIIDVWGGNHHQVVEEVLERGRRQVELARALLEQPSMAWWFETPDTARQVWVSYKGEPPQSATLVTPSGRPSQWDIYAQKAKEGMFTSTLIGEESSVFAALDIRAGDYYCSFPITSWSLEIDPSARIFNIDGPQAWHNLCVLYPVLRLDGRLTPDWAKVAMDWDAVHLTFGGLLTAEQVRIESAAGWSQLDFWHAEQTLWLRWMVTASQRLPDHERNPGPAGLNHPYLAGVFQSGTPLTNRKPSPLDDASLGSR